MDLYHASQCGVPSVGTWDVSKARSCPPIIAYVSGPLTVATVRAPGSPSSKEETITSSTGADATSLSWHPTLPLLAIGWTDGSLSLWNASHSRLVEQPKEHAVEVTHLVWSAAGTRLASADNSAKVVVWAADEKGRWRPLSSAEPPTVGAWVTHLVWDTAPSLSGGSGARPASVLYGVTSEDAPDLTTIRWLEESGGSGIVFDLGEPLAALLPYPEREQLVAVSLDGAAFVLSRPVDAGRAAPSRASVGGAFMWTCTLRMVLAKASDENPLSVCWAGPHTVAIAMRQDLAVRLFDLDTQDNALLPLEPPSSSGEREGVACLSWSESHQQLAVGTTGGSLQVFKRRAAGLEAATVHTQGEEEGQDDGGSSSSHWLPQYVVKVGPDPLDLSWGPGPQHLGAYCQGEDGLWLSSKQRLLHKLAGSTLVLQVAPQELVVQQLDAPGSLPSQLQLPAPPLGLDASSSIAVVHGASTVQVYRLGAATGFPPELTGEWECTPAGPAGTLPVLAVCSETIYRVAGHTIEACNLAGTVKQTISLEAGQGSPLLLTTTGDFLGVVTSTGLVRVFKAGGREARPHAGPGCLVPEGMRTRLRITAASLNATGTMLAGLATPATDAGAPGQQLHDDAVADSRVFVYCSETNSCWTHDFAGDGRLPVAVSWDVSDPRLLAVQVRTTEPTAAVSRASSASSATSAAAQQAKHQQQQLQKPQVPAASTAAISSNSSLLLRSRVGLEVALLFSSAAQGLVLQEYQDCSAVEAQGLLGLAVPHLLLSQQQPAGAATTSWDAASSGPVVQLTLQGFAGCTNAEPAVRAALLDFAYHLALGAQEEAFRAVAALNSPAVWRTMAHVAIKSKRLDVAEHCLGNMEHVRGARALRQAAGQVPQLDARVGLVAVHLGLTEDAKRLFAAAGRWDLLTQLLAATGEWEAALQVAGQNDRLHLDALRYSYAQHLEACGDVSGALQQYSATAAGAGEVPRLLWRQGRLEELEAQVMASGSPQLLTWWARFCEASGNLAAAQACYQRSGNHLAMVRVHCATGNWAAAEELVRSSGDAAAAFHLGRLYEAQEKVGEALRCYAASKRYAAGVRLATRYGMTQEVLGLALQAPAPVQLEAADALLGAGATAAAAQLYQAGGKPARALQLAASAGHSDVLEGIAAQLGAGGDPAVVARCAEAFLGAGHYDKAASLLARVGQISRALDLLQTHDLPLSEELAEALTPPKEAPGGPGERQAVLLRLAQLAKSQGLWGLAAKKYTQAGDRLAAMKALVKARDTEKVVFFAGVSRQAEVYLLAANYLQTLEWRTAPDLTKNIVLFYTKAGAHDSLARFYESCAELEIDATKDYAKALQAYREATKQLAKAKPGAEVQEVAAALAIKADNCERFLTARAALPSDPAAAVAICQALLADAPMDAQVSTLGVDPGDVYALLVEWCYGQGHAGQALQLLQQMCGRGLHPDGYMDGGMLAAIYQATGASPPEVEHRMGGGHEGADYGAAAGGEVEEELPYLGEEVDT